MLKTLNSCGAKSPVAAYGRGQLVTSSDSGKSAARARRLQLEGLEASFEFSHK